MSYAEVLLIWDRMVWDGMMRAMAEAREDRERATRGGEQPS